MFTNSLDLIIYAVIAVLLIFKLINLLGKKDEGQPSAEEFFDAMKNNNSFMPKADDSSNDNTQEQPNGQVIDIQASEEKPDFSPYPESADSLQAIYKTDNSFTIDSFLEKARFAFETILEAYAQGDEDTIKSLVNGDIKKQLLGSIQNRAKNNYVMKKKTY